MSFVSVKVADVGDMDSICLKNTWNPTESAITKISEPLAYRSGIH